MSKIPFVHQRLSAILALWRAETRAVALAACSALLVAACGGGGGGGGGGGNTPQTGTLEATVVDEFGAAVSGARVAATVDTTTRSANTNSSGVATVTNVPTGNASVEISLETFQTQTVSATINANQTTSIPITLIRNTQAAGGVLTSQVVSIADSGKALTIRLDIVVVSNTSEAITTLTDSDFVLPACTPVDPVSKPDCLSIPNNAPGDTAYTVDNAVPANFGTTPGNANADYAAALMLDQSGSVNSTDPTGARLFSAKAFVQTVDAASNDSVLLAAFADDNDTQTALIPDKPLTTFLPFTSDGKSYFDELEGLRSQAAGGTPLYRALFPEDSDVNNDPAFTEGLIDIVAADAPAGLRKAIVLFTDGEDSECGGINKCRAKRQRVIDRANANSVDIFTIGLSDEVDFEALGELARGANGVFLFAQNAEQLIPLYGSLGALLSRSLLTYHMEWTVRSATDGTFVSGRTVLGHVQIDAAGTPIEVPFIVGIP